MFSTSIMRVALLLVVSSLLLRLAAMAAFPLFDTTEARYGEMARLMWQTGNWVTPLFDYGVPFWGKPPMQTWVSAAGISLLGLSEFSVRLPHFLAGVGIMALCWCFARRVIPGGMPFIALLVLACSPGFMLSIGMVMTDTLLTLSVSISLMSFWWAVNHPSPLTRQAFYYGGFIGLGIGMLAKGPVALVLVGLAMLPWLLICRHLRTFLTELPWFTGAILMVSVCGPWYLMAEHATPGFLEYFIVGEHWLRFTVPGWEGDLYGNAHEKVKGTIWLYLLIGSIPWLPWLLSQFKKLYRLESEDKNLVVFLLCWFLSPAILFTFAGNILPAYVMPGIPALALLVTFVGDKKQLKRLLALGLITPLLLGGLLYAGASGQISKSSEKSLLASIPPEAAKEHGVFYLDKRPFSGQFYSSGIAKQIAPEDLYQQRQGLQGFFVVEKASSWIKVFDDKSCALRNQNRTRLLYYCSALR